MRENAARELNQEALSTEQRQAEYSKQVKQRNRHQGDGGIHAVARPKAIPAKKQMVESRTVTKPKARSYTRPSALPAIPDIPGYHVEYVRRDNNRYGDYANLRMHQRSGWEIVRHADVADEFLPTTQLTGFGDCIGNDDSVAMKLPMDLYLDREAQDNRVRDQRTRLVNSKKLHAENNPVMPIEVLKNTTESELVSYRNVSDGDDAND